MALAGWEPLLDRYTTYRVGRRVRPIGTTFSEMADDVIQAIDDLGGPLDLLGASTGGIIALEVAAARPDLIRRLVLVITGTRASPYIRDVGPRVVEAARAGRWRSVYSMIMPIGGRSASERLAYRALGWIAGPRLIGIPDDPTLLIAELEAWQRVDAEPFLSRIACPALVLAGALDRVFPVDSAATLAEGIAQARLVVMPRVAHDFPASAIADHISSFLDEKP